MLYEYAGVVYPSRSKMCAARREHYVELLRQGLNFTQAAKVVGVSKRTGKVWRNGRRECPIVCVRRAWFISTPRIGWGMPQLVG